MNKALPVTFLFLLLFAGCASRDIEIGLPHSGERVNLTVSKDLAQDSRLATVVAGQKGSNRSISYSEFSGAHIGMHQQLQYAEQELAYNFTRDMYSSVEDRYACIVGDCAPFLEKKPTPIAWEFNNFREDYNYRVTVCFQNGSYSRHAYVDGVTNNTQGTGCPNSQVT